ncbi:MAG: SBBP repeat-containing protein [Thermoplasmata archaeon]|nr:MAG: SBBP repeat-containing protein [Thermoplasmata archaeon]
MRTKVIRIVLCVLMLTAVFGYEIPHNTNADVIVNEEWVARYNGFTNGWDVGSAIAVDSSGNVYSTGRSYGNGTYYDYTTVKYDNSGNELWVARYNGPGNDRDEPADIVLDTLGNAYVTGLSIGNATSWDYATIKYDSLGNELWVVRYDGPEYSVDSAEAIAIGESGNIYVTGGSKGECTTIAYDSNGNELWIARYSSPEGSGGRGLDIALDQSGNIYVTGGESGNGTDTDSVTIKYDSDGNELWVARYNGPGNGRDRSYGIELDSLGNVYIAGDSYGNGTDSDYFTIKYDPNGTELWVVRYDGPGNDEDIVHDMDIDSLGNVFVTGHSYGTITHSDATTVAYDSSGNELWVARFNGPVNYFECSHSIAVDSLLKKVYVTGDSYSNVKYYDIVTITYDYNGNELWVARYDGPGNRNDGAYGIATDSSQNVYVTGYSWGNGSFYDFVTIKYSQKVSILQAIIDIDPDTLNLKSKGRWITCYIDLPGYDVNDIDIGTILLEDTISAEWGDVQNDTLMVKFDRSEVEDLLSPGNYNLKVTGELTDGIEFKGFSDEIRVIEPP